MRTAKLVPVKKVWILFLREKFWIADVPRWISDILIFPWWCYSDSLWSLARSRRDNQSCSWLLVSPTHTVPLKILDLDHQLLFLIGWYSASEIWCLIKKLNENDKNTTFMMRKNKKRSQKKHSLFWTHLYWPVM